MTTIAHKAGPMREGRQECVLCGRVLSEYSGTWTAGAAPRGWDEGAWVVMRRPPPSTSGHVAPGTATPTWEHVVQDCQDLAGDEDDAVSRVWRLVAEDGAARDAFGAEKYGTRHQHDNRRDHAYDAYQEAMDGAMYWKAEHLRTQSPAARKLYLQSLRLAFDARAYLLRRDGR